MSNTEQAGVEVDLQSVSTMPILFHWYGEEQKCCCLVVKRKPKPDLTKMLRSTAFLS